MMPRIPTFLTTLLLCAHLAAPAQDEPVTVLRGIIKDAATGEPIPLATISVTANGITTISNEAGYFVFKIPTDHQHDSIYISHVGYSSVSLPSDRWRPSGLGARPTSIIDAADTSTKTINLHQTAIQLPGVTVLPVKALELIDRAIAKIPDNYPARPFVSIGFYRLTSTLHQKIIELSEAVFDIYSPDNQRKNMQFRLIKARADRDLSALDGQNYSIGRKPDDLMDRDMVSRIHETQILGDVGRNDHQFTYNGLIDYEGHTAYEIGFDQKDEISRPLYKGRIIIDTASLAFLCFDYGVSPKGLPFAGPGQGPLYHQLLSGNLVINYRRYGGKYYLNHVYTTHNLHLYTDGNPPADFDTVRITLDYLVTRIDTGFVAYSRAGKKISGNKAIEHQVRENTRDNDSYWENYNAIEADFNVDSALATIRRSNLIHHMQP